MPNITTNHSITYTNPFNVGGARVAMNAKQETIKRFYSLFMLNDNCFLRVFFFHFSTYQFGISVEKQKEREIRFEIMC